MTIRQKTITVVAAVLIATTCLVYGFSRFFLARGSQRIELLQVTSDLDRILGIVEFAVQSLDTQVADWSAWDDPYQYMQDHNETFPATNLRYESFVSIKTDLVVFLDTSGKVIVGKSFDFDQEKEAPLPEGLGPYLAEGSPLVRFSSLEGNVAGVVLLKEGPMLVAARPIITSARQGPIRGTLIMGRRLNQALIERFEELTHLSIELHRFDDEALPDEMRGVSSSLASGSSSQVQFLGEERMAGYALLKDVLGNPAMILRIEVPRSFHDQFLSDQRSLILGLVLTSLVACVIVALLIDRLILARCASLNRFVTQVGTRDSLSARVSIRGNDELSALGGSINRMLGKIESDIEERVRAEEALRENEEKLRAITSSAKDAILMMDPEGRVSFWNDAASRIFGWSGEEAIGKNLHLLLVPQRYHPAYKQAFAGFQQTGQGNVVGQTLELAALRRDGAEFPMEMSLASVKLGGQWYGVGIVRDITERRRMEHELVEAKEAAEGAAKTKAMFLANMSHEIRTPMNGVIGMNGLLLDTELTAEQRQYAEIVSNSANALLAVINDILDFSKIEAGKLDLEILDFDLRTTIEDMNDILAIKPQEKGIEYACVIAPEVPVLLQGDPGRLRQVLTNLIGNAVKFTSKGEIIVRANLVGTVCQATTNCENEDNATIRFAVTDTGIGIPKEKVDSLFEVFTQVDASVTRKYGGTGLGLAISRQLVTIMGGEIGVDSEPGKGSTFWFTVKFGKQPTRMPVHNTGEGRQTPVEVRTSIEGMRILIVDDNSTNRFVLREQLRSWRCQPEEACDAETAIEKLRTAARDKDPFKIAILDMQMPDMDGDTLGRMIREDQAFRDTRLVMLTSVGKRGDAARLAQVGFSAYLTKPVRQSRLYDCMVEVACGAQLAQEPVHRPIITKYSVLDDRNQRIRILLAEDNITNQIVAVKSLEKLGYRADAVANGAEAVKALETVPYDLVFMDVQMPEMDGFEATKLIRDPASAVQNHAVPIIAMTAHAMKGDREECLRAGMDDYVSKPVNLKEFASAIQRQLARGERYTKEIVEAARIMVQHTGEGTYEDGVFDKEAALSRVGGDETILNEILAVFLEDAVHQIDLLRQAAANNDAVAMSHRAHSLKGASGSVGAIAVQKVAFSIETAGRDGDPEQAASLIPKLQEEFDRFRVLLAPPVLRSDIRAPRT